MQQQSEIQHFFREATPERIVQQFRSAPTWLHRKMVAAMDDGSLLRFSREVDWSKIHGLIGEVVADEVWCRYGLGWREWAKRYRALSRAKPGRNAPSGR